MPDQAGTLERIAIELANVLELVADYLSEEELLDTLAQMGVAFPEALLANTQFTTLRQSIGNSAAELGPAAQALLQAIDDEDVGGIISAGGSLLENTAVVIDALDSLGPTLNSVGATMPGITAVQLTELTDDFAKKFFDLLVVDLLDIIPAIGNILTLLGIIGRTFIEGDDTNPTKPDFEVVSMHFDRLAGLFGAPETYFRSLYDWGDPAYDGIKLLQAVHDFVVRLGLPAILHPPSGGDPAKLEAFALDLTPIPPPTGGLQIEVVIPIGGQINIAIPLPHAAWTAELIADVLLVGGATATLHPPFSLSIAPPSPAVELEGQAKVNIKGEPAEPFIILGQAGGSRLEVGSISGTLGVTYRWDSGTEQAEVSPMIAAALKNGKMVIDGSSGDGFIATLLSSINVEANFDAGLAWSMLTGLRFEGSSTLEIELPVHITLGPISIPSLYIVTGFSNGEIPIEISASLGADLGPMKAVVERMGLKLAFSFPPNGGNIGPAQLDVDFKPPNGVGLSIDTGAVKGGGYLFFDHERGEYAGALELDLSGLVSVKAIGLISTRMPDGSEGFSLLIIITAEFGAGIQLGLGFVLLGVGGLLGLNRTMRLEPLAEGIRTGAAENILFPTNVVENAPQIISDLRLYFPPQQNIFLIGPMAKLGWGVPALVTISLGVIIEIPGNLAILGLLKVVLPDEEAAILILQVSFLGAIEFDKKRIWFFASLFGSRIVFMTIAGDMGLLVAWGQDANFVISVGGFHPQFDPPSLPFPTPQRVSVDILNVPGALIRVSGYFAVTSNTVQFGARADLRFGLDEFGISGHIGFDALFQFSPFYFILSISGSLSVKVFGIGLFSVRMRMSLEGPTPWRAKGTGSISLLFFSIDVDFDITWGEERDTRLPPIQVMPLLKAEFEKDTSWSAEIPASNNLLVSIRKLDDESELLVLHPIGKLKISQRAVPLDYTIDKVGNQKPSDASRFSVEVTTTSLEPSGDSLEQFALGQYKNFSDAEKLSLPAFSDKKGGIHLSSTGNQFVSSKLAKRNIRYETIIIDTHFKRKVIHFFVFWASLFLHFIRGNATAHSPLSQHQKKQYQPFAEKVTIYNQAYTVAFNEDNRPFSGEDATFSSEAMALDYMGQQVAEDPNLGDLLHVIPNYEVNELA